MDFQDSGHGDHLGFPIGTNLTIFDRVNMHFSLGAFSVAALLRSCVGCFVLSFVL